MEIQKNSTSLESNSELLAHITNKLESTFANSTICATVPKKRKYFENLDDENLNKDYNQHFEFTYNGYPVSIAKNQILNFSVLKNICISKSIPSRILRTRSKSSAVETSFISNRPTRTIKPTRPFTPEKSKPATRQTRSSKASRESTSFSKENSLELNDISFDSFNSSDTILNASEDKKENIIPEFNQMNETTRKRKPQTKTPDELKDEKYYIKRMKNNEAAKKSRDLKKAQILESANRLKALEEKNGKFSQLYCKMKANMFDSSHTVECPKEVQELEDLLLNNPDL